MIGYGVLHESKNLVSMQQDNTIEECKEIVDTA